MASGASAPADIKRIGRYRIVRPLSKGGMALVYEARRESLAGVSPRVAIKLILPEHKDSATFRDLFINEARLGAKIEHQNLVQIQDFSCEEDTYFLVMEYVEGFTLRRVISLCAQYQVPLPLRVIAELGRQACDGLHYAHCAKDEEGRHLRLVHRDVKPSNLMLNPHGVLKVLDFGISKGRLLEEREGVVKGTWGYMAPEQAAGAQVWPTADVFGLAVVLYELASRRPMFQEKRKDEIKRLLADDHAVRMAATLDPAYAPMVGPLVRALQRDPKARYSTAEDFGRALSALLPDPITARDEVVRFYEKMEALDQGKLPLEIVPAPVPTNVTPARPPAPASVWWTLIVPAALGATAVLGGVAALATLAVAFLAAEQPPDPASPDLPAADSEPLPSPVVEAPPAVLVPPPPDPAIEPPVIPIALPEELDAVPTVVPVALPVPTAPSEVVHLNPPPPVPAVASVPPAPPEPDEPLLEPGTLQLDARQPAEVYIAGQFVQKTPYKAELQPGKYSVSLVAEDGRRRTFEAEVVAGKRARFVWDFDRQEWR